MYEQFISHNEETQLASLIASNNIQNVTIPRIDKLTLLFDLKYPEKNLRAIEKHPDFIKEQYSKNRRLGYQYTLETASGLHIDLAQISDRKLQNCRMEFNPNTFNPIGTLFHTMMLYAKNIRISRIDYNIDFHYDLSEYRWQTEKNRSQVKFISSIDKLETLYLGKSNSRDFYRIYDKRKEQGEPENSSPLWRIEHVHKLDTKTYYRNLAPFDTLYGWKPDTFTGDYFDDLVLSDLHANPDNFNRLSTRKRATYRQLMKNSTRTVHPDQKPSFIYEANCQPLNDFLYHLTTGTQPS